MTREAQCFCFSQWEKTEQAARSGGSVERAEWKSLWCRGLMLLKLYPGDRRMDSKAQRSGLALKKRRATPPHPGGMEVREGVGRWEFLAAVCGRLSLSRVPFSWQPRDALLAYFVHFK